MDFVKVRYSCGINKTTKVLKEGKRLERKLPIGCLKIVASKLCVINRRMRRTVVMQEWTNSWSVNRNCIFI